MANPAKSDVYVDKIATAISIAYKNDSYIATEAFPVVPVKNSSGKYFVFEKGWLRDEAKVRAPGAEYPEGDYELDTSTYTCKQKAYAKGVADEVRDEADDPLAPDRNAAEFVTEKLLLNVERAFASNYFATGKWTNEATLSGTSQWSDYTNSDPLGDIETGVATIAKATAMMPNTLILGFEGWRKIKHHPDMEDKYKYTQKTGGNITPDLVAQAFELKRVLVSRAIYDTTAEGETPSTDWVMGKHALLLYVPPSPSIEVPSAGYTFQSRARVVKTWRDGSRERDVKQGKWEIAQTQTSAAAGYFIQNVVA